MEIIIELIELVKFQLKRNDAILDGDHHPRSIMIDRAIRERDMSELR